MLKQIYWDYWSGDANYEFHGKEFTRLFSGEWEFDNTSCNKHMQHILEDLYQKEQERTSKYQASGVKS